jgi:predicted alpha/beta-hydrolase family hydrolase
MRARPRRWLLPVLCVGLALPASAADPEPTRLAFEVNGRGTSALWSKPADARRLVVLGHGARLDMASPLLAALAEALAGQSMSGLIVTRLFEREAPPVSGVAMIGYPLHQPGRPSGRNARRLEAIPVPLLLVQGSRDPLAELRLMRVIVEQLEPRARLHVVAGADHLFEPEPGSGSDRVRAMIDDVAVALSEFVATVEATPGG